jgi:membrane associated rhomboid family serine protease
VDDYYRSSYRPGNPLVALFRGTPPATRGLVAICVFMYAAEMIAWVSSAQGEAYLGFTSYLGLTPALFIHGFLFQAVTYLFIHGSLTHLAFNMLTLWMFGAEMERLWGTRRFLWYYAVCGIGAALLTVAVGPFETTPTIGASGAILGVVLAYGMAFPNRTVLLYFVIPMSARLFVLGIIVLQFVMIWTGSFASSNVAVVAHLGGMLAGYLYLKRVWRVREFFGELRWKMRRRRLRVITRDRDDGSFPFH